MMDSMITITIPLTPTPASRPRVYRNGGRSYSKAHTAYEASITPILAAQAPTAPLDAPVAVSMEFISAPYKTGNAQAYRSDLDNLAKLPLDVMTKCGFWTDDYLITDLRLSKRFCREGEQPQTIITIK